MPCVFRIIQTIQVRNLVPNQGLKKIAMLSHHIGIIVHFIKSKRADRLAFKTDTNKGYTINVSISSELSFS